MAIPLVDYLETSNGIRWSTPSDEPIILATWNVINVGAILIAYTMITVKRGKPENPDVAAEPPVPTGVKRP